MTRRAILNIGMAAALIVLVLVVQWRRVVDARDQALSAEARLEQLQRDAREVMELRAKAETVAARPRPTQDVLALVNRALAESGVPGTHLAGLGQESDSALPQTQAGDAGPALRRQSLQLRLERLTPAQLGAFIERWRELQEPWTIERLELTHRRDGDETGRYDARLILSAVYVADG